MSRTFNEYSRLTEHDYKFLQGDDVYWPGWGAALGVCQEWCRNSGYGEFGKPTDLGKEAMLDYERRRNIM